MRNVKNALLVAIFCTLCVLVCGCSKKAYAQPVVPANEVLSKSASADYLKIENTFKKINPRAYGLVDSVKSREAEFLSDLSEVLAESVRSGMNDKSLLFLIDKKHKAESSYVPKGLIELKANEYFNLNKKGMMIRPEAYEALKEMSLAAKKDGITLLVSSVYRSYEYQDNLFNYWVRVDGLEEAERESARPGTSQHQLATAVDFGSISDDFGDTAMGQWVYKNATSYGWSLSFPKGYEDVTGYRWECWHFRFIGKTACRFQKKWFGDVQQFMLEFLNEWNDGS